ncbi:hypothetical protein MVEN_02324500 [Mycena venus]|uniref:Uncharacterized protein n=1 Tax=Mycena venus TaxID=2733690 RepID=A0A8H7CG29_9AGAR|nr:hypothetical protein MVEN_02324500 [Mycena venus]
MVWEELLPESKKDHKQAEKDYPKVLQAWKQKVREAEQAGKPLPAKPKQPVARMQEGEDLNFLRFSTFLRMIIGMTISKTPQARRRIKQLPQDFLLEFLQLCEADSCKPNLHWAIHVPEQIRDFGPLHGFWAFLPERLNKVLKNTNSNNWTGGRLEVSMMREFQWVVVMHTVLDKLKISHGISAVEQRAISFLLGEKNAATIGTAQDAARSRKEGLSESPILAYISWMQESRRTPLNGDRFPWSTNFPELGIESWVARGTVTHMIPKMWMTVALDRFPEHDMNGDLEEGFIL